MAKIIECAADPRVTPAGVIAGHVQNKLFNFGGGFAAAGFTRGAAIVLFGYPLSVPSKQGVRRDDSSDLEEPLRADGLSPVCQTSTLTVSKQYALPADLLAKHSILGMQVIDDILLVPVHPTREHQH